MKKFLISAAMLFSVHAFAGYNNNGDLWTIDGKVPVVISGFTTEELTVVRKGIDLFQRLTPVRIVHSTNDQMYYNIVYGNTGPGKIYKYVHIVKSTYCAEGNLFEPNAYGSVTIGLGTGCIKPGYIAGKLGKAVGLRNEHQRSDRDLYVKYNEGNVNTPDAGAIRSNEVLGYFAEFVGWATGLGDNIEVVLEALTFTDPLESPRRQFKMGGGTAVGEYDYCSFTHFGLDNFNNTGKQTLVPLRTPSCYVYNDNGDLEYIDFTGQRLGLSLGDVAAIEAKYANVQKYRPIVYLNSSYSRPASNVIRFTVSSAQSHAALGAITSGKWTLNHTPSCQMISGGSGAPGCLHGTSSYVREISKTMSGYVFEIVNDRSDSAKVTFTATDTSGRTFTDTIDVRR